MLRRTITIEVITDFDNFDTDNLTNYIKAYDKDQSDYQIEINVQSMSDWTEIPAL